MLRWYFSKFKILLHIVLLKCQIAFLKFISCDNQALVVCIPIAAEILKTGLSSYKTYSNNIVNFQESTTILNACTKKSGNLLNAPHMFSKCQHHI